MPEFRGVVFDDVGVAVEGATVNLYDTNTTSPSRANAETDGSGLWHIGESGTGSNGAASVDFDTRNAYDVKIASGTDVVWLRSRDRYQVNMMQAWQDAGATTPAAIFTNADAGASSLVAVFEGDSASPADNDEAYISYKMSDDGGTQEEVARVSWQQYDVNPAADGGFEIEVASNGTLYKVFDAVTATGGGQTISIGTGLSGTAINIGHTTSTTTIKDDLAVDGILDITDATDSSDATGDTGALRTEGGASIAKKLYVGTDVSVGGNLNVSGTTTTVDTTNTTIKDVLIKLGQGTTADPSSSVIDLGIIFTRGNGSASNIANRAILWDESADEFAFAFTNNEDGATSGNVDIDDYADVHVGKITADDASTFTGGIVLGTVAAAGTDTDKFLVLDGSGNVDYRTGTQVLSDIGAAASKTYGISDDNAVEIDGADIADNEYARFTANGLESRTAAEVAADIEGSIDAVGALNSGSITSGFGTITAGGIIKTEDTTNATSTTDGSLQTDGGLSVVLDAVFGDDVTLITDSAVLNLGVGSDVKLTHDGTTGGTLSGTPVVVDSLGASALANDTYTGLVLGFISNEAIAIGNAVYIHTTDGRIGVADANALATMPAIGVAVSATGSAGNAVKVLTHGIYNDSDGFGGDLTEAATMYLGETTGAVTATIPDADGDFVQVMGIACGPRDVFINPSLDIIERAG